jgi:hypothetical protein
MAGGRKPNKGRSFYRLINESSSGVIKDDDSDARPRGRSEILRGGHQLYGRGVTSHAKSSCPPSSCCFLTPQQGHKSSRTQRHLRFQKTNRSATLSHSSSSTAAICCSPSPVPHARITPSHSAVTARSAPPSRTSSIPDVCAAQRTACARRDSQWLLFGGNKCSCFMQSN